MLWQSAAHPGRKKTQRVDSNEECKDVKRRTGAPSSWGGPHVCPGRDPLPRSRVSSNSCDPNSTDECVRTDRLYTCGDVDGLWIRPGCQSAWGQGAGQTIALIDAFDDANIESDLGVFDTQFSLPDCTTANGCFTKIYATGTKPGKNKDWALEESLDVEWSNAIAPQAKIIVVEAAGQGAAELLKAVDVSHLQEPVSRERGACNSLGE